MHPYYLSLIYKESIKRQQGKVKRICEKWEGKKQSNHHGDFYIKKKGRSEWYVMECKGVKSNSEKWHKLYNYQNLLNFLFAHRDKINWISKKANNQEEIITKWIEKNLPKCINDYSIILYDYEEIKKYFKKA